MLQSIHLYIHLYMHIHPSICTHTPSSLPHSHKPPPPVAHDLTSHSLGPHGSMMLASVVLSHALILPVQAAPVINPNISSHPQPPRLNPWIDGEVARSP